MSGLFDPVEAKRSSAGTRDAALVEAYLRVGRTLDDLPYTDDFERVYEAAGGVETWGSRRDALHRLMNLRKAGKLPKLGRAASPAVMVTADEDAVLIDLVVEAAGTLGQRDQLLYDAKFDGVVQGFNARTGRNLGPHDVWRLVAKLAK
ncbi:MAG: hypothetical protein HBSAPP03_18620 [Phycisphaerae bacterium]|nr:MAG: hypothetical protein HBSAPP03_18620 [Phycisphaerae bacterium]